jgi:glyoxylase-like metal-dependent hydrolase (beta-lactamase superfamily II)
MIFEQIRAGGDRNFAYLIGNEETLEGAVVDPASKPDEVLKRAAHHRLAVKFLFNTHDHYDHTEGNRAILAQSNAGLIRYGIGEAGDGSRYALGSIQLTLIHTPGHTADSACFLVAAPGEAGKLITGDTLFVGKVGGTGFGADARQEYDSLHQKLMTLPDETEVWPGHDYGTAPSSTIGREKRTNPFLLRPSFEAFVDLKMNWAEYKREHGIA